MFNEHNGRRADFGLADVFGIHKAGEIVGTNGNAYLARNEKQHAILNGFTNTDGIPDAVVGTFAGTAVLLGRGDGTLAPPKMVGSSAVLSLVVADFNNDGNPDIAATILTN